jgi:hypothetical protein
LFKVNEEWTPDESATETGKFLKAIEDNGNILPATYENKWFDDKIKKIAADA